MRNQLKPDYYLFTYFCVLRNDTSDSGEIIPTRCNNCVYSSQWSKAIAKNKRNCCILLELFHY